MRQVFQRHVLIPAQDRLLQGELAIPEGAAGLAIFAHGSAARLYHARHPRVAGALNQKGIGTLLLDLLSAQEEMSESWSREPRLAIDLLAARLLAARNWLLCDRELCYLAAGYFGSTLGAAAALVAATRQPERIAAIVSRSGRPDLVADVLPRVRVPTLLIVAGEDVDNLLANQRALEALGGEKSLRLVPYATHGFTAPDAIDDVARLACEWFSRHFREATQMKYGWTDERWV